ncbi:hypothetical protein, partial [Nocardia wallacei]|uniref:hypothetical protein n=1 Tax=Nocardia wallacei TaxID=480035 RepID=UPI002458EB38
MATSATGGSPPGVLSADDVRELALLWERALSALAAHAGTPGAGGHTPSDFDRLHPRCRRTRPGSRSPATATRSISARRWSRS